MSCITKRSRTCFKSEQLAALRRLYEGGLNSAKAASEQQIAEAAEQTNLSAAVIKTWIRNQTRKDVTQNLKKRSYGKRVSAFQVFCRKTPVPASCLNKPIAVVRKIRQQQFNDASQQLRDECASEARAIKSAPVTELTAGEKKARQERLIQEINEKVNELGSLGAEVGCMIWTLGSDELLICGTAKGRNFLRSANGTTISFMRQVGGNDGSGGKLNNLRAAVRDMLNKKYGIEVLHGHNMLMTDFVGSATACFAYANVGKTFKVVGLPDGVELSAQKTPSFYGTGVLSSLLAAEPAIILERLDGVTIVEMPNNNSAEAEIQNHSNVLEVEDDSSYQNNCDSTPVIDIQQDAVLQQMVQEIVNDASTVTNEEYNAGVSSLAVIKTKKVRKQADGKSQARVGKQACESRTKTAAVVHAAKVGKAGGELALSTDTEMNPAIRKSCRKRKPTEKIAELSAAQNKQQSSVQAEGAVIGGATAYNMMVLGHKPVNGQVMYLVRWTDFPGSRNTWERSEVVHPEALQRYMGNN